jgi:hypothetical protein
LPHSKSTSGLCSDGRSLIVVSVLTTRVFAWAAASRWAGLYTTNDHKPATMRAAATGIKGGALCNQKHDRRFFSALHSPPCDCSRLRCRADDLLHPDIAPPSPWIDQPPRKRHPRGDEPKEENRTGLSRDAAQHPQHVHWSALPMPPCRKMILLVAGGR